MRRTPRLIAAAVLIAFSGVLGGCSSGGFDPSDLMDFLDTKKKLPGERKPVFPEGVPGLEQGVPKELYKGAQQQDQLNADTAAVAPEPPPEPAKPSKSAKSKKTRATAAAAPADTPAAEPDGEAVPAEAQPAAPPPPKHKIVRRRTTAPPPDQPAQTTAQPAQSSQSAQTTSQQSPPPFPAPLPSGTFQR